MMPARITEAGRRMAQLGAHPRLAAMLLAAETDAEAALAADLAALLEERDPLRASPTGGRRCARRDARRHGVDTAPAGGPAGGREIRPTLPSHCRHH